MKVLIAEDDLYMQKIIALYLEKEGVETYRVADGEAALAYLEREQVDLAILDWMMPKIDGIQVARYMKESHPKLKIVMLTAKGEIEDEVKGLRVGADDYIKKPFDPRVLMLRIKKLLGEARALKCRGLKLDLESQRVFLNEGPLSLSKKEYELLEYFLRNKGLILSREMLLDRVF